MNNDNNDVSDVRAMIHATIDQATKSSEDFATNLTDILFNSIADDKHWTQDSLIRYYVKII
ncbi:MAG: hypothetical protein WBX01_08855 [Nitrososphaeraceae archaeon]|jgi:hypothetical protein